MWFDTEICEGVSCHECSFNKEEDGCLLAKRLDEIEIIPEPCEDAVSRRRLLSDLKELIAAWKKYPFMAEQIKGVETAIGYVQLIPSVKPKPEQQWIPVSERLPEDFQRVLVTIVNYEGDKVIRVAEYHNWKGAFQIKENHEQWKVGEKGLLAWMPLPEPYREEDEK